MQGSIPSTAQLPVFHPATKVKAQLDAVQADNTSYFLHQPHFAKLATSSIFSQLEPQLLKIDISAECAQLEQSDYLEVTFPAVGVADLLGQHAGDYFAQVLAINAFGGGEAPHPAHVVAIDIIGNKYEVLIDQQGQLTLPEEGTGLFSMLSAITLMYDKSQILNGMGLESLQAHGAQSGFLYVLPPSQFMQSYSVKVATSHLDDHFSRQVDSIRSINIEPEGSYDIQPDTISALVKMSYTAVDLQKDLLVGDDLNISFENGFNNFALLPEGVVFLHQQFAEGVSLGLPEQAEYFNRVNNEHFEGIDLALVAANEHDFEVIDGWSDNGDFASHFHAALAPQLPDFIDYSDNITLEDQSMNHINTLSFYDSDDDAIENNEGVVVNELKTMAIDASFSPLMAQDIFSSVLPKGLGSEEVNLATLLPEAQIELHASMHSDAGSQLSDIEYTQGITNPFMFQDMPLMIDGGKIDTE